MSINSLYPTHSFPQNWSSQDLADAMPRRLSELMTPELMRFGRDHNAANGIALSPWAFNWRRRDDTEMKPFLVR